MAAVSIVRLSLDCHSCIGVRTLLLFATSSSKRNIFVDSRRRRTALRLSCHGHTQRYAVNAATPGGEGMVVSEDYGEPISRGTMKLPSDINLQRFETLLFQWANSLCQGANLPLPVPLKVEKVNGGVRVGFIGVQDGKTQEYAYIDCLVCSAADGSGPIFRALRNGPSKGQVPPGEPRIMRSLFAALQKSVELSRVQG